MKIAMACDHGGLRLKNVLKEDLEKNGYEVVDFGTYTEESCDYPDYASKAAKAVADLLYAYEENPKLYSDSIGIPESGNGTPDVLDKVRYELE